MNYYRITDEILIPSVVHAYCIRNSCKEEAKKQSKDIEEKEPPKRLFSILTC
jgi:hypothetical protein